MDKDFLVSHDAMEIIGAVGSFVCKGVLAEETLLLL